MENLAYWNLRAVEARIDCQEENNPENRENLLFARSVVCRIERVLFNERKET